MKGDIQAALGHVEEARAAYLAAMVADGSELLDRNFLQMKLNDLPGAAPDAVRLRRRADSGSPRGSDARRRPRKRERARDANARSLSFAFLLLAMLAVVGCASKKDTTEPPAELVEFKQTLDVRKVWSGKVGGGAERLRLGLRPATDGARIYAGSHDGQVAAFDALTGRKQWSVKTKLPLAAGSGLRRRRDRIRHDGRRSHRVRRRDRRGALAAARRQRGPRRSGDRCARDRRCAPSTDGCAASRSTTGATLWTVEQNLPALDPARQHGAARRGQLSSSAASTTAASARTSSTTASKSGRSRSPTRRAAASSNGSSTSARACRWSATRRTSRVTTAAPSASTWARASCCGSKTCRRTRGSARTSRTSM